MNSEHYTPTFWELPQKKCNRCGRLKALDHFSPDRRIVADGLQGICKSCRLEDQKKRYTPKRKKLAPEGYQKCTVCGEVKVLDKFSSDKRRPLGKSSRCKSVVMRTAKSIE